MPPQDEAGQPNPFALGLPTPTNTVGVARAPTATRPPADAPPPVSAAPTTPVATTPPTATVEQAGVSPIATGVPPSPTPVETPTPAPPAPGATDTPTLLPSPTPAPGLQATLTATPAADATATPATDATATPAPTQTPTPTETVEPGATPTRTRVFTVVPADTPTSLPSATPTVSPTPTSSSAPVPWDLARDVIGMWEFEDDGWNYYFDFFADGRVIISQNGIRPYQVRDAHTLVLQMANGEWVLNVTELTAERMTLEGFVNDADTFQRVHGTPDLAARLVGLWLDVSGEYPSIEFTANGIVVSEFGRGTYQVTSDNSVLIACDQPEQCEIYLEFGQQGDAPLPLRIYSIADNQLTLQGFGYGQQWTLDYRAGIPNLAAGLLGRWEDEWGSSVEFRDNGDWIVDDEIYGHYEVLSSSTLWTELEGYEEALVVTALTANQLTYAEWGYFYEDELWVFGKSAP